MLIRILAVIALLVTSVVWAVKPAAACSCAQPEPEKRLQDMDAAVVGRVVSRTEPNGEGSGPLYGYIFTIETEKVLKGDIGEHVEVRSSPFGGQCGFDFGAPDGERVGLFMQGSSRGGYESYSCLAADPDVLAALDPVVEQDATFGPPSDVNNVATGSNTQLQAETQPQELLQATGPASSDIALWSAVSFGGLTVIAVGYAVLRKLNLRSRADDR